MKKFFVIGALACLPLFSMADTGIGVSVQSDDGRIYIPHDISDTVRIEPSFRYYKTDIDNNVEAENYEVAVGLFYKRETFENMNLLLGARVGYIDFEQDYDDSNFNAADISGDGYVIAPTLGFEYFFHEKFSVGGEVALRFEELERDSTNPFTGEKDSSDQSTTETDTSLNVRFYF